MSKRFPKPEIILDGIYSKFADETGNTDIGGSLTDAIDKLGEPYTTIFIRKYFFGQTSKNVAKDLDIKPNTVDNLTRGRKFYNLKIKILPSCLYNVSKYVIIKVLY